MAYYAQEILDIWNWANIAQFLSFEDLYSLINTARYFRHDGLYSILRERMHATIRAKSDERKIDQLREIHRFAVFAIYHNIEELMGEAIHAQFDLYESIEIRSMIVPESQDQFTINNYCRCLHKLVETSVIRRNIRAVDILLEIRATYNLESRLIKHMDQLCCPHNAHLLGISRIGFVPHDIRKLSVFIDDGTIEIAIFHALMLDHNDAQKIQDLREISRKYDYEDSFHKIAKMFIAIGMNIAGYIAPSSGDDDEDDDVFDLIMRSSISDRSALDMFIEPRNIMSVYTMKNVARLEPQIMSRVLTSILRFGIHRCYPAVFDCDVVRDKDEIHMNSLDAFRQVFSQRDLDPEFKKYIYKQIFAAEKSLRQSITFEYYCDTSIT